MWKNSETKIQKPALVASQHCIIEIYFLTRNNRCTEDQFLNFAET